MRLLHTLVQQYFARYHFGALLGELLVFLKPLQPCFCLFYGEIVHLGVFLRLVAVFDVGQHVIQGYARACEYRLSAQDSLVLNDVYFLVHDFQNSTENRLCDLGSCHTVRRAGSIRLRTSPLRIDRSCSSIPASLPATPLCRRQPQLAMLMQGGL